MPRFFLGNFEFEHRLAEPFRQLPIKLDRINAELATSWLSIAEDGDYVWTPLPIESSFFERAVSEGLAAVIPVVSWDQVPAGIECVPWGWTDPIRKLCDTYGWIRNEPADSVVRAVNSRRQSASLERDWSVGLDGAAEITSMSDIESVIRANGESSRWVIKAEFGMSGRERLLGLGLPSVTDRRWLEKRLSADGVVFFEPWVERLHEAGIQIQIPQCGEPKLIGITPMFVDQRGQYAGSQIPAVNSHSSMTGLPDLEPAIKTALHAADRLCELGYFGPLGIDAMWYRHSDGTCRIRPLQDINARWTMGRLALGFQRLLKPGETACWVHRAKSAAQAACDRDAMDCEPRAIQSPGRTILTSSEWVGDQRTNHESFVSISSDPS